MNTKKFFIAVAIATTTTLFTCEQVPDYCSNYNQYNPEHQFCFGGRAVDKCGGASYNPQTQGCISNSEVGTLCADSSVVSIGTLCGTHTLSIAVAPSNGGTVIGAESGEEFGADERVPLLAHAEDGFMFLGWAGVGEQDSESPTIDLHIQRNTSVIAIFRSSVNELITEAFPANSGTISVDPEKPVYTNGERVTVTATASDGFVFDGWSGASSSNSAATTVTMDGGQTLVAIFKPVVHTLNVSASPREGGSVFVNGTAFSGAVNKIFESENVLLFARADSGFVFSHWSGDASGTTSTTTVNLTN